MVRISSGRLKGRKVVASKKIFVSTEKDELRPTSSKVRQAVFNIVQGEIDNALFLDLYAGTGAVGLEALSRGAEKVFFAEKNQVRAKAVADYIHKLGLDERASVYQEEAMAFLKRAVRTGLKFDIIFIDPPYLSNEIDNVLPFIGECNILKKDGCILIEHSSKISVPQNIQNIKPARNYRYGDTMITLYRME